MSKKQTAFFVEIILTKKLILKQLILFLFSHLVLLMTEFLVLCDAHMATSC